MLTDLSGLRLSLRARSFVRAHGKRVAVEQDQPVADSWTEKGLSRDLVRRASEYESRWGRLYLPPSLFYNGGPRYLGADILLGDWSDGGYFEAGPARFSVAYDFLIGPDGAFGVGGTEFVPLYSSVEDWIESVALEYLLRLVACDVRRFEGAAAGSVDLSTMSPFPGISGLSDRWLTDGERVAFVCRGIGMLSGPPADNSVTVYSQIPDANTALA